MNNIRGNNNVVYVCRYHVVFCPKYRRKVLVLPIDERLKVILAEQIERWEQKLIEVEFRPITCICSLAAILNSAFTDW